MIPRCAHLVHGAVSFYSCRNIYVCYVGTVCFYRLYVRRDPTVRRRHRYKDVERMKTPRKWYALYGHVQGDDEKAPTSYFVMSGLYSIRIFVKKCDKIDGSLFHVEIWHFSFCPVKRYNVGN